MLRLMFHLRQLTDFEQSRLPRSSREADAFIESSKWRPASAPGHRAPGEERPSIPGQSVVGPRRDPCRGGALVQCSSATWSTIAGTIWMALARCRSPRRATRDVDTVVPLRGMEKRHLDSSRPSDLGHGWDVQPAGSGDRTGRCNLAAAVRCASGARCSSQCARRRGCWNRMLRREVVFIGDARVSRRSPAGTTTCATSPFWVPKEKNILCDYAQPGRCCRARCRQSGLLQYQEVVDAKALPRSALLPSPEKPDPVVTARVTIGSVADLSGRQTAPRRRQPCSFHLGTAVPDATVSRTEREVSTPARQWLRQPTDSSRRTASMHRLPDQEPDASGLAVPLTFTDRPCGHVRDELVTRGSQRGVSSAAKKHQSVCGRGTELTRERRQSSKMAGVQVHNLELPADHGRRWPG